MSDTTSTPDPYPEHAKLEAISHLSQNAGEFLAWLEETHRIQLCQYLEGDEHEEVMDGYYPSHISRDTLLGQFYGIDAVALEKEKQAMLDELRKANSPRT